MISPRVYLEADPKLVKWLRGGGGLGSSNSMKCNPTSLNDLKAHGTAIGTRFCSTPAASSINVYQKIHNRMPSKPKNQDLGLFALCAVGLFLVAALFGYGGVQDIHAANPIGSDPVSVSGAVTSTSWPGTKIQSTEIDYLVEGRRVSKTFGSAELLQKVNPGDRMNINFSRSNPSEATLGLDKLSGRAKWSLGLAVVFCAFGIGFTIVAVLSARQSKLR